MDGEQLNNPRFTDDKVLIANNARELSEMLREPNARSRKVELKINAEKSKIMHADCWLAWGQYRVDGTTLEEVYLDHEVNMRHDLQPEI